MPYKDPKKACQCAKENYERIKVDPIKLAKRRERCKLWRREWRKKHLERARQLCRESVKRNYDSEKHSAYIKEWRKKNPYNYALYKEKCKENDKKKRLDAIEKLGAKCTKCGISDERVLEAHHVNGRKSDRYAKKWYRHLNETKEKIILVCSNCHIIEHSMGN